MRGYCKGREAGYESQLVNEGMEEFVDERKDLYEDALFRDTIKGKLKAARELSGKEKEQAIEEWQEDFSRYQLFWADTLDEAVELLADKSDISKKDFMSWFDERAVKEGFCTFVDAGFNTLDNENGSVDKPKAISLFHERAKVEDIFRAYRDVNRSVTGFFADTGEADKFAALTIRGEKQKGKVIFEQHPFAVIVTFENPEDSKAAMGFTGDAFTTTSYSLGEKGGWKLAPIIALSADNDFSDHEKRHAINKIVMRESLDKEKAAGLLRSIEREEDDEDEMRGMIYQAVSEFRKTGEKRAVDEILAYVEGGESQEDIRERIAPGPYKRNSYQYFKKYQEDWDSWKDLVRDMCKKFDVDPQELLESEYTQIFREAVNQVLVRDYGKAIDQYLEDIFYVVGEYGEEKAVSMMSLVPIDKWTSTVDMIIVGPEELEDKFKKQNEKSQQAA